MTSWDCVLCLALLSSSAWIIRSRSVVLLSPSFSLHSHVSPSLPRKYVHTYTNILILIISMACRAPSGYKVWWCVEILRWIWQNYWLSCHDWSVNLPSPYFFFGHMRFTLKMKQALDLLSLKVPEYGFFFNRCAPLWLDELGCWGCITTLQRQKFHGPEVYIYSLTCFWRAEWFFPPTVLSSNSLRSHDLVASLTKTDMGILKLLEGIY